jgi:hypothetical protein
MDPASLLWLLFGNGLLMGSTAVHAWVVATRLQHRPALAGFLLALNSIIAFIAPPFLVDASSHLILVQTVTCILGVVGFKVSSSREGAREWLQQPWLHADCNALMIHRLSLTALCTHIPRTALQLAALAMRRGVAAAELRKGVSFWRFAGSLLLPVIPIYPPDSSTLEHIAKEASEHSQDDSPEPDTHSQPHGSLNKSVNNSFRSHASTSSAGSSRLAPVYRPYTAKGKLQAAAIKLATFAVISLGSISGRQCCSCWCTTCSFFVTHATSKGCLTWSTVCMPQQLPSPDQQLLDVDIPSYSQSSSKLPTTLVLMTATPTLSWCQPSSLAQPGGRLPRPTCSALCSSISL